MIYERTDNRRYIKKNSHRFI